MILGIGLDVVAVERIARSLSEGGGTFEEHIFTPAERAACQARADRARALAARFAAKEACFKALGTGRPQGSPESDARNRGQKTGCISLATVGLVPA